jgi:tetratricopeptide (TPR) repeat protein
VEPKSAWARYGLADYLARSPHWTKAAAGYLEALEVEEPVDMPTWFNAACTILHAGNTDGYRKLCERMARRYGYSQDPHQIAFLAHVCVLAPNALPDSQRVLQLAEQRIALTARFPAHKLWSAHVLGLACYRAGKFERAIATLEAGQKQADLTSDVKMSNWLTLAMSRQRLGQHSEAAAALESARTILTTEKRELDQQNLVVQILFREAESLLSKP